MDKLVTIDNMSELKYLTAEERLSGVQRLNRLVLH